MSIITKTEITDIEYFKKIKHPWQPDWVVEKSDVDIFLKLLDDYRHLVFEFKDWYPPFIIFMINKDGKKMLATQYSSWFLNYDPFRAGKRNPLDILKENGIDV